MKPRRIALILLLAVLTIGGCVHEVVMPKEKPVESETGTESLNNKYAAGIVTLEGTLGDQTYTRYAIRYTKDRQMENYFVHELRPALDWIIANTPEDASFFNWWDYGHMIQGYTGREVVLFSPSDEILWSLASGRWDEEKSGPLSDAETVEDVAYGLLSRDPEELIETMQAYDTEYIFVSRMDETVFRFWLEKFAARYGAEENVDEVAPKLVISKMLEDEEVEGFERVYSDDWVKIYRLK